MYDIRSRIWCTYRRNFRPISKIFKGLGARGVIQEYTWHSKFTVPCASLVYCIVNSISEL